MASTQTTAPLDTIQLLSLVFKKLKASQFTGELILTAENTQQWTICLYLGRITCVDGGNHSVRRWRRCVATHCPEIDTSALAIQQAFSSCCQGTSLCWQYSLLALWVKQQRISSEQAAKTIQSIIQEVVFDIAQALPVTWETRRNNPTRLLLLDAERVMADLMTAWEEWQSSKLSRRSPNLAPTISKLKQLPTQNAQTVLLDGQHTLRDLAMKMKRNLIDVVRSLTPYIDLGIVELKEIPDLPPPRMQPAQPAQLASLPNPLIACVDDSPMVCQGMQTILTAANYRFVGVSDPLRAIATLLSCKPQMIFLDLMMPNTNGYELCSQLRKLSVFRDTPIVILTGQDGIIDRVRAKFVGATDFLSKPATEETVISVIRKYLKQPV